MSLPHSEVAIWIDRDIGTNGGVRLALAVKAIDRTKLPGFRYEVMTDATFSPLEEGSYYGSHTMHMSRADATELMDGLWQAGVRPSDVGTPGHLAATQAHLKQVSDILSQVLPRALRRGDG